MATNLEAAMRAARLAAGANAPTKQEIDNLIASCSPCKVQPKPVTRAKAKKPKECCKGVARGWKFSLMKQIGGAFHNHMDAVMNHLGEQFNVKHGERLKLMRIILESTGMWTEAWDRDAEDAIPHEIAYVPPSHEIEYVYTCLWRNWRRWAARGHCGSEAEQEAARAEIRQERMERGKRSRWPLSQAELEEIDVFGSDEDESEQEMENGDRRMDAEDTNSNEMYSPEEKQPE
jgi:hypothetical protein